ncbi:unnamed protein product [Effrenium voratum]|uniref:J domain-containing protein n=1 Tax=Effrenium voratum TaxID=2562239 RepID=A0AA36MSR0_9DINO|nr:unnamed protein product [Effrenium voratum]
MQALPVAVSGSWERLGPLSLPGRPCDRAGPARFGRPGTAWPVVALFAAAGARICRPAGAKRPCTQLRARNDPWFATVKTTELEEALRSLGFDDFPKVQRRNHLTQWIQKLRIPYELVEGALKEVRMNRKAEARKKAKQAANAKREEEKRAKEQRSKQKKFRGQSRRGGLFQFTEGQLRSVLNLCGVQGTSQWPKEDLVKKLERLKIHVADVEEVMAEVEDPGFSRRSRRSRRSRPRSRAEREFYNSGIDDQQVREFLREEYEDWDDRYDSVDDYYRYTMDDEPWESVPWDFDDFLEEDPYERQRGRDYSNADSTADPWASGSWTYSSSGYGFRYGPGPASSSSPKGTPEETMIQAIQEGWKVDSLSRIQACQLLGLSHSHSLTEVRRVRREMALRWHPDKNPGNANAAVAFQLVMAAAGGAGTMEAQFLNASGEPAIWCELEEEQAPRRVDESFRSGALDKHRHGPQNVTKKRSWRRSVHRFLALFGRRKGD